jgi:hypothetical protein
MGLVTVQRQSDWFVPFDKSNPTYNGTNHSAFYSTIFETPSDVSTCFFGLKKCMRDEQSGSHDPIR